MCDFRQADGGFWVATNLIAVARTWSFWIVSLSEMMKKVGSGKPLGSDCTDATCLHHPLAEEIRIPGGRRSLRAVSIDIQYRHTAPFLSTNLPISFMI
jgi:hypothetical protein